MELERHQKGPYDGVISDPEARFQKIEGLVEMVTHKGAVGGSQAI